MEYRKDELEKIKERTAIINENLGRCGIFPDRNEPTKSLSRIQETILKATFELRVAFLEPMTFMFAYCISAAVLEKTIIELEKQGYIESRTSKDLGKCWCLTSKALYYITQKQDKPYKANDIPSDNIPKDTKLILYKCINSYYAMRVFETMNFYLWNKFKGLEKSYRVNYSKSQYLVQCEFQKGKKGYSKREADKFVKANIDTMDMNRYYEFTKYCKGKIMEDSLLMHSYMKEYASVGFATAENSKEGIEHRTPCEIVIMLLYAHTNGVFRSSYYDYRTKLYQVSLNSNGVKKDFEHYLYSELSKRLAITRRSIMNSKTEGKTEQQLQNISHRINEITLEQHKCDERVKTLSEDLTFSVFERFSEADFALFGEEIITLEHLRNMNVYLTRIETNEVEKPKVVFAIFPNDMDEMGSEYLFKRLERLFLFWQSNLCMMQLEVEIVTYGYKEETKEKLKGIKAKFCEISKTYSLFRPMLDEIRVIDAKNHYKERYEVFNDVKKALRENKGKENVCSKDKTEKQNIS